MTEILAALVLLLSGGLAVALEGWRRARRDVRLLLGQDTAPTDAGAWGSEERRGYEETAARAFRSLSSPSERAGAARAVSARGSGDAFARSLDALEEVSRRTGKALTPSRRFFREVERTGDPGSCFSDFREAVKGFLASSASGSIAPSREDWLRVHGMHGAVHEMEDRAGRAAALTREQEAEVRRAAAGVRSLVEALVQERSNAAGRAMPGTEAARARLKESLDGRG